MRRELEDTLDRLGLPSEGPVTEEVTLLAIAPWFQALITTEKLQRTTLSEVEEIGDAVKASLTQLIMKRGRSR